MWNYSIQLLLLLMTTPCKTYECWWSQIASSLLQRCCKICTITNLRESLARLSVHLRTRTHQSKQFQFYRTERWSLATRLEIYYASYIVEVEDELPDYYYLLTLRCCSMHLTILSRKLKNKIQMENRCIACSSHLRVYQFRRLPCP